MERRSFLGNLVKGAAAGYAAVLASGQLFSQEAKKPYEPLNDDENPPLAVSSWTYGLKANAGAFKVLAAQGTALDAVEQGIRCMEEDPGEPGSGIGALPDSKGRVSLDACIMDHRLNVGAVAGLEQILHPVTVARQVMEKTTSTCLIGEGALAFALEQRHERVNLLTTKAATEWQDWVDDPVKYKPSLDYKHVDAIGTLVLDRFGNLAGATSSAGAPFKQPYSMSDSAVIGAGLFVDNEVGAAVSTGNIGDSMRFSGAHLVVELMRQGRHPEEACYEAVERIFKHRADFNRRMDVGFLALRRDGQYAGFSMQAGFGFAVQNSQGRFLVNCKSLI